MWPFQDLSYDRLAKLKQSHPTWRLLNADNAPLVLSFCYEIFIKPNCRSISSLELLSKLDDYLYSLRAIYGEKLYPKSAKAYLADWSDEANQFLRLYYVEKSDEPQVDLTPATEKALEWLQSLEQRQFISTESRLLTLFQLLRDLVYKTEQDPSVRIAELERQKNLLDLEIDNLKKGVINPYDPRQIKETFIYAEDTARKLLSDFRQIEQNFRDLDSNARKRIATSDKHKGDLLDEIFAEQDVIRDSDQGKSFKAFWEFLMSPTWQNELQQLVNAIINISEISEARPEQFFKSIDRHLVQAGEKVYKTNNLLAEQLRKFLDSQAFLENKRIMELIKLIEKQAVQVKDVIPKQAFAAIQELKPEINLIMSRDLFTPPKNPVIREQTLDMGISDISTDILYQQTFIDEQELLANIRHALADQAQISLSQLIKKFPVRKGLAEIVSYVNLANKQAKASIDSGQKELFDFVSLSGTTRRVELPQIIFLR